jgi:hypothetical protein
MKITFKQDTGKVFATSPEFLLDDAQAETLLEFVSNAWEEVPEAEWNDDEGIVLWFSEKPADFQAYVDEMAFAVNMAMPPVRDLDPMIDVKGRGAERMERRAALQTFGQA